MDAVRDIELKKATKPADLPFAPLIEATRATDFGRPALTDRSSPADLKAGCKALADKLKGLELKRPKDLVEKCEKLMRMLKYPSKALRDALAKELAVLGLSRRTVAQGVLRGSKGL